MKTTVRAIGEDADDALAREAVSLLYRLKADLEACDEACMAHGGVTASQGYTLLALPPDGSLSMNELSESMGLAGSTMTRMLDTLVKKGLAYREPDAADRRIVRVGLSAKGKKLQKAFAGDKLAIGKAVLARIKPGERKAVLGEVAKLADSVRAVVEKCASSCLGE